MSDGISYLTVIKACRSRGFIEVNHYDQSRAAIKWRAAVRRACRKGLLQREPGATPARTRYRLKQETTE